MAPAKNAAVQPAAPPGRGTGRRIVIVGGGMAAARLVQQLAWHASAERGVRPSVTVIGEERHAPYNRVLLADVLAGRYAPEVIALPVPPSAAHWLSGVRAVRVDRAARRVLCDNGQCVPYDVLVLATGSNPVLPPLRGLFRPEDGGLPRGVHAFRTMDDCLALAGAVRPGTRAVVIGGGLLGVSAARALAGRSAQVVLAQQGEHLMERQLDAAAAGLLRQHVETLGVEVHTECRVRGVVTDSAPADRSGGPRQRSVTAVELADGFRLDAELVVLTCGVRPRGGLARAAGLEVAHGIVVDDELRTSDPHIHAIGDCAEHGGVVYGLAGAAQEQADALAAVLTADQAADQAADRASGTATGPQRAAGGGRGGRGAAGSTTGGTAGSTTGGTAGSTAAAHRTTPGSAAAAEGAASGPAPRYAGTRALTRLTLPARHPAGAAVTGTGHTEGTGRGHGPTAPPPAGALDLAAFGEIHPAPGDDVIHLSDATRGAYRKVVVRGDRLVGGILLGDLGSVGALARTWEGDEPLPSAPLLHLLTHDGGS